MLENLRIFLKNEINRKILFLCISGVSLIISFIFGDTLTINPAWVSIILCGIPIVTGAIVGLITKFDIKADVLVSMALIASIIIGEIFAAGEVAFIMQIGALLEELTVSKAQDGIEKLIHLSPRTARIINGENEKIIPAEDVKVGDMLRVLAGETIAVDGEIVSGRTSIDQSVMTGESLLVDKEFGDQVSSGTVNQFGTFEMIATKVGEDSSLQRMIRLVQSADAGKAKIVGIADRWATWIVVIAVTAAILTWIVTGEIIRGVTILVVFCPCALVLATPTAIMAAIGNATKYGILVKEGDALERLFSIKKITFDKTGTLTTGILRVISVKSILPDISDSKLYQLLASAESRSEHPLGKAIVKCYKNTGDNSLLIPDSFVLIPGRGVNAVVGGNNILAGNKELFNENNIYITEDIDNEINKYLKNGCTSIYISVDGKISGYAILSDTVRDEAAEIVQGIKKMEIIPVLLTGDHPESAKYISQTVGISEYYAECLPENKMEYIQKSQENQNQVCMIGDGINDAPALKKSHVGIAMGGIGSDIAMDAADIVLVGDDISEIPHLLQLSKKMMVTIKINLTLSMLLNFVAIILAMTGILNPVLGALVHNVGSVVVIINSALLLKWRKKN